jgi:mannose-1-phosphate guanylyltransferase / mannose-6-phosphate isomerase
MAAIMPVIMCGGSGTRLWPLSRAESPKQFQRIDNTYRTTFFQETVLRHTGPLFETPMVLINEKHIGIVLNQLNDIQTQAEIIVEPCSRNTGPAMAVAALQAVARDRDAILLTVPSDHLLSKNFNAVVEQALQAALEGYIVTFGINPSYPESGYGYIVDGGGLSEFKTVNRVAQFVEKPGAAAAGALIAKGGAYWASGIALFRASALIEEFKKYAPDILQQAQAAIATGSQLGRIFKLGADAYAQARNESCEYAVIEKSARIALAPANVQWDDVGAWPAFYRVGAKNEAGNVTTGDVLLVDTHDSYIRSESRLVTVIGLQDLIVVDTADALLITTMSHAQGVKKIVETLALENRPEVMRHTTRVEEWGTSNLMATGQQFSLRHLQLQAGMTVSLGGKPGMASVVSVVEGAGAVFGAGETRSLPAGGTYNIELGETAILHNTGQTLLQAVEMLVHRDQLARKLELSPDIYLETGMIGQASFDIGVVELGTITDFPDPKLAQLTE